MDNFSTQSATYQKFRPTYPVALYNEILTHVEQQENCWDCATGNGQVAKVLSEYFENVQATDLSSNQIKYAPGLDNVKYSIQRAEQTGFFDDTFDLITVAQAIHWFDVNAFHKEVYRVCKPNGIIAIWGYGLLRFNDDVDHIIDRFYTDIIGSFWDPQRSHIDDHYERMPFPYEPIELKSDFQINVSWTFDHLIGYLSSWSSVQHYKNKYSQDPLKLIKEELQLAYGNKILNGQFPIFLKLGRV